MPRSKSFVSSISQSQQAELNRRDVQVFLMLVALEPQGDIFRSSLKIVEAHPSRSFHCTEAERGPFCWWLLVRQESELRQSAAPIEWDYAIAWTVVNIMVHSSPLRQFFPSRWSRLRGKFAITVDGSFVPTAARPFLPEPRMKSKCI